MQDRFIRLSVSLARLQKVIQRIKTSGMGRIALKAGHTLVLCQLAAAPEGWHFSDLTERCDLDPAMPGCCIVSKRYLAGGGLTGSVALIGSTRMEYERLLPILDYFAAKLGQSMAGQGQ